MSPSYLPHGFDALFEHMVVRRVHEIVGAHHMVVERPKLLDLGCVRREAT